VRSPHETGLVDDFSYDGIDLIANFSMLLGKIDKRNLQCLLLSLIETGRL